MEQKKHMFMPFCPQINETCKGKHCICFEMKGNSEPYCRLFNCPIQEF